MIKQVNPALAAKSAVVAMAAIMLASCGFTSGQSAVTTEKIAAFDQGSHDWLSYGGGYDEKRHSRLDQINPQTIDQLEPVWTYEMRKDRGVEATALVHNGTMYVTSAWSVVYALDAKTGEEQWVYDPQVPGEKAFDACCDVVNRGVALYEDKVFVGTLDGRLEALDAETGEVVWSTLTVDPAKPYTITGAPRAARGLVFIGNGGAEFGVRGYISAYDAQSGELVWRFYTTPNPDKAPDNAASDAVFEQFANASWGDEGGWQEFGGGGTVWDSIVYDHVNGNLIFGVGNGSPWNAKRRDPNSDGDNLFLSSIVALDALTGEYRWHFQTTPRDNWDYTATQTIILADLPLGQEGASRRVVMQAPKNGFFYVLDAATGEFVSGDPFANVNWATGLDESGRPIESAHARSTEVGALVVPGSTGAHNWHPMAFNPDSNLAYIPTQLIPAFYLDEEEVTSRGAGHSFSVGYDLASAMPSTLNEEQISQMRAANQGFLTAFDPSSRRIVWQLPLETRSNSGILSTASGLVFQGNSLGELRAYDAKSGDEIWKFNVGRHIMAAPMTYEIDGEQYLAVPAGAGGAYSLVMGFDRASPAERMLGQVIVFKLGGGGSIPEATRIADTTRTPKSEPFGDNAMRSRGALAYNLNCLPCHGVATISGGVIPDLRWSAYAGNAEAWRAVVIDGALSDQGMVSFADALSAEDAEAIRAYVIEQAHVAAARNPH